MSWPLEGSRDVHDGIIVSLVPDVCLTPGGAGMVPVPYTIWCRQADAANLANSIHQTDDRSHAKDSLVLHCYGDEPGTGGGVTSGTTGADCTPKTWSNTVRLEGRNMVRHLDEWWMNHRNTYGQLIYTKDMNQYDTPAREQIVAKIRSAQAKSATAATSQAQPSPLSQAYTAPATPPGIEKARGRPQMGPTGFERADTRIPGQLGSKIETGARIAAGPDNCCIDSYYNSAAIVALPVKDEKGETLKDSTGKTKYYNKGGLGGCQTCKGVKKGVTAHHGIVDYTVRSGRQSDSSIRAPNAPSYWEALTVCLPGDEDHDKLHNDFATRMSDNTKDGLSTWKQAKDNSFKGIDELPDDILSKFCKEEYKRKLSHQYSFNDNMKVRVFENKPPDADPSGSQYQTLYQDWKR